MKSIIRIILERIGFKFCKHCGSVDTYHGYYSSGYNHLCSQASGDYGLLCRNCWKIEFDESFEARKKKKPEWVELYK